MARPKQTVDVAVYTSPDCQFCHLVKAYLRSRRVDFREIDIAEDPDAGQELFQRTGVAGLPVTFFGNKVFVLGFDRNQLDSCLQDFGWL